MIRRIKIIYDFFRLWIMWGDRKEAWEDAKTKNDPEFQEEMNQLDKSLENNLALMDNLEIFTKEFNDLRGQFVICSDRVYRFIGIGDDDNDYYYALYDGRKITLHSCVGRITPLKGYILQKDYDEMIRLAKLNHFDQSTLWGNSQPEEAAEFSRKHKEEITDWKDARFILGPYWDLN